MKIAKVRDVRTPERAYQSAAYDFYIPNDTEWDSKILYPGNQVRIKSGIRVELAPDQCLLAVNKSGIAVEGLQVGACLIDPDYQGELHLHLVNHSDRSVIIKRGQKIVQFLLLNFLSPKVTVVDESELHKSRSTRGELGFGSSGN